MNSTRAIIKAWNKVQIPDQYEDGQEISYLKMWEAIEDLLEKGITVTLCSDFENDIVYLWCASMLMMHEGEFSLDKSKAVFMGGFGTFVPKPYQPNQEISFEEMWDVTEEILSGGLTIALSPSKDAILIFCVSPPLDASAILKENEETKNGVLHTYDI